MKIKGLNITKHTFDDIIITVTIDEIDFELPNNIPLLKESVVDLLEGFGAIKNATVETLKEEKP